MTRINVIPPAELTDQHLIAEYRELPRAITLAAAALKRAEGDVSRISLPPRYRMREGHVRFFYDKTGWLSRRHAALVRECQDRGFNVTLRSTLPVIPELDEEYEPDRFDRYINLDRLRERLREKEDFYRHRGALVQPDFYG